MEAVKVFLDHMDWNGLGDFLLSIFFVFFCLSVHEASHGLAAYLLGDPTAKVRNRISLNPLRHLDPLGAIMMLLLGFGWAKPVPVDLRYFRNPRRGMAITALAGPLSNFILAYVALLLRAALFPFGQLGSGLAAGICDAMVTLAIMSLGLGVFNLIPIPPLDGSRILQGISGGRLFGGREFRWQILIVLFVLWDYIQMPLLAVRNMTFNTMVEGTVWLYRLVWKFL